MPKVLDSIGSFIRSLAAAGAVGLAGIASYFGYNVFTASQQVEEMKTRLAAREGEIKQLSDQVQTKQQEIERLDTAMRLLTVDQRVARLDVIAQTGSAEKGDMATKFRFVEVDQHGKPLESPREFTIKGDLVYVDAWVVKFQDKLIEEADPGHTTSVFLFRRLFGEAQQPKDGFVIDSPGSSPAPYRTGKPPSEAEKELWSRFWEYANDHKLAESKGIRAAHGEAPSIKMVPGGKYRILLRSSGGLSITPDNMIEGEKPGPT